MSTHAAVVTGGGRGIGRAIVDRLHSDGAKVLTCGRSVRPHDLSEAVEWVQADVSVTEQAEQVIARARELFGGVTLLVNNAGIQREKTVADSTDDDWDLVIGVNCRGVFNTSRAVLPGMSAQGGGVIINIGSVAGFAAETSMALYNASKAFVHGLTRSIAVDHGPYVRCNAISPGWIDTQLVEDGLSSAADPQAARHDTIARHPMARLGTPEDVANAVAWLASSEASFVTGQCITVDGGLTAASPIRPDLC